MEVVPQKFWMGLGLVAILCLPQACCLSQAEGNMNEPCTIVSREGERVREYSGACPGLLKTILVALEESDDFLDLIVTEEMVESLRRDDDHLEFQFKEPRTVLIRGTKKIRFSRLLVTLSGRFAGGGEVTFFWGDPEYSSGPAVNFSCLEMIQVEISKISWETR